MKRKKNNLIRFLGLLFLLTVSAGLCGCSLAKEEGANIQEKDRLLGGFVTRTPVMEKTEAQIEYRDENYYFSGVQFGDLAGQFFYYALGEYENGETYVTGFGSTRAQREDLEDGTTQIKVSRTFYFAPEQGEHVVTLYLNPVYETKEGVLYVLPGQSVSLGVDMHMEGTKAQLTLFEEERIQLGENITAEKIIVQADFEAAYEVEQVTISEINERDEMIHQIVCLPEELKRIDVQEETAYVVIEKMVRKSNGILVKEREICAWDGKDQIVEDQYGNKEIWNNSFYHVFLSDGSGFLENETNQILWKSGPIFTD